MPRASGASLPVIETASVILSFGFAVLIGVFSGIYPAWSASRIAPIEALRYGLARQALVRRLLQRRETHL